jgi:FAD/FMN-containing dehydrogenase
MTDTAMLDMLRGRMAGQIITPGDAAYDEMRQVFNAMHARRPAVIARCRTTADVVAAVTFARETRLLVAVRSGGHSVAGLSVCDDGILIDLGGLKDIQVDPAARTARAGGGVLWGEFDAATQEHALHTPGGRVTTTGVGGFTTGGGYGWTSSRYGLTCDNLLAAEVVLADGSVVTASDGEHPDLFWGIRGGGSNFGIVTEFTYRLHPLGPIVLAGLALWPIDRAGDVVRAWRDHADNAPDELSTACVVLTAPPEPFVPEALRGRVVLGVVAMYVGDAGKGASIIQPIRDLQPAVDLFQPMPYLAFQAMIDPSAPKGHRSYWRGEYLESLPDAAIDTFVARGAELTAASQPYTQIIMFRVGQAVAAFSNDATPIAHRRAQYMFHPIAMWQQSSDDERLIAACRAFCDAMRPFTSGGAYLNFTPEDRVRDAYGAANYARLVAVKDRYDPENLFRMNQNIRPSKAAGELALA